MARVLIVGCGCRGQALARELRAAGHAVRGTTRDPARFRGDRGGRAPSPTSATPTGSRTLMEALTGVTILCWLMGTARGRARAARRPPADAVGEARRHAGARRRLRGGRAARPGAVRARAQVAAAAHATWMIPLRVLEADPADHAAWRAGAAACRQLLARRLRTNGGRLIERRRWSSRKSPSRSSVATGDDGRVVLRPARRARHGDAGRAARRARARAGRAAR